MLKSYADKLQALAVFRGILADETVACLLEFLKNPTACTYGDFVAKLYVHGDSLTDFLLDAVTEDENPYMKRIAEYKEVPAHIDEAVRNELAFLEQLSRLTSDEAWAAVGADKPYAPAREFAGRAAGFGGFGFAGRTGQTFRQQNRHGRGV